MLPEVNAECFDISAVPREGNRNGAVNVQWQATRVCPELLKCLSTAECAGVAGDPRHGIQIPTEKRLTPQLHDRLKLPDVLMRLAQKRETDMPGGIQQIAQVNYWNTMCVVDHNHQGCLSLLQKTVECPNRLVTTGTRQQNLPNALRVFMGKLGGKLAHD
ncbi:hypothetical protein D3C76_824050 [compost metagenome]